MSRDNITQGLVELEENRVALRDLKTCPARAQPPLILSLPPPACTILPTYLNWGLPAMLMDPPWIVAAAAVVEKEEEGGRTYLLVDAGSKADDGVEGDVVVGTQRARGHLHAAAAQLLSLLVLPAGLQHGGCFVQDID